MSPAQAARASGVTVRALRVYEQRGLVRPIKSGAGWRAYGPEALGRLHQVLALKRLGLSLKQIAVLMSGRLAKLDSVLELQEVALARRREDCERGLGLVRFARARIASGHALSLDDLTTLTRETTMSEQAPDWVKKMQPIIDAHLTDADKAAMRAHFDPAQGDYGRKWEEAIGDATALLGTDPASPKALDVARRWRELAKRSTAGDPAIYAKMGEVWRQSLASPEVAPTLPFSRDVWNFVGQALAHLPPD
ncbi:MAG: MerR family transcriptional regulator [Caulobacteraceae bacterium]